MLKYTIRRLIFTIPVLLFISLVIFLLLDLSPGDPTAQLPMTVPPEVREHIRQALGLGEPMYWRYLMWCNQFFIIEPLNIIEQACSIIFKGSIMKNWLHHIRYRQYIGSPRPNACLICSLTSGGTVIGN